MYKWCMLNGKEYNICHISLDTLISKLNSWIQMAWDAERKKCTLKFDQNDKKKVMEDVSELSFFFLEHK